MVIGRQFIACVTIIPLISPIGTTDLVLQSMFSDGINLVFNRPYGTVWFDALETGNELPAYYQLPLRGIYRQPDGF